MDSPPPADASASDTVAKRIAQFVTTTHYTDLPADMVRRAKTAILDTIGAALAGSRSEACSIIHKYVHGLDCRGGSSTVFGTPTRTLAHLAALANGSAINTNDFDDTYHPSRTHTSGPVLAAVFAQAEQSGASGKEVLTAFSVGAEVTCKISQAIDKQHYLRGFHATSTCGVIGAAAGVARLLHSSSEAACAALGIAASHSAGFRENFGSMTKALHSGRAAENGIAANSLASLGLTAAPTIFEGARGFFLASGGGYDAALVCEGLGHPWSYVAPGVATKPFPSGNISHPAMCGMLELVLAHDIRPQDVRRVTVRTNRLLPLNLTFHQARTGLEGQLSMEFCLASMLVKRRAGLAEFTDAVVGSPEIQDAMAKIRFETYSDEEAAAQKYVFLTSFLDIEMNDGRRYTGRADAAKGSAALPMNIDEVSDKFRSCAEYIDWPKERVEQSIELLLRLEELDDVRSVTELLRP